MKYSIVISYGSFSQTRATGQDEHGRLMLAQDDSDEGAGCVITIFNPYTSGSYTFIKNQSSYTQIVVCLQVKEFLFIKKQRYSYRFKV